MRLGCLRRAVRVSTTELAARLGCSQQSASRHLRALEGAGLVSRRIGSDGSLIRVTGEGRRALEEVYTALRGELDGVEGEVFEFEGTVFSGMYQGRYYITRPGYRDQIVEKLGLQGQRQGVRGGAVLSPAGEWGGGGGADSCGQDVLRPLCDGGHLARGAPR
jgi:CTP-dependent riboflavin kinase